MSAQPLTRLENYGIDRCPLCGESHSFTIEVSYISKDKLIYFGGHTSPDENKTAGSSRSVGPVRRELTFTCPNTHKPFIYLVEITPGHDEEIVEVRNVATSMPPSGAGPQPPVSLSFAESIVNMELQEWVKASPAIARDFCKQMLSTTTAAIPVFFAVLKYLGVDKATVQFPAWIGILPPSLFLLSAILFILTLRPQYFEAIGVEAFTRIRTRRIQTMNWLILIGTALFIIGAGLAIGDFVYLVTR